MKVHQSSLSLFSANITQKKSGDVASSSDTEKQKILPIQATKNATELPHRQAETKSNFNSFEIERPYRKAVNQLSASRRSFEQSNTQLNSKSLHAISAYINEQNQPEQEKLTSLITGFHITI